MTDAIEFGQVLAFSLPGSSYTEHPSIDAAVQWARGEAFEKGTTVYLAEVVGVVRSEITASLRELPLPRPVPTLKPCPDCDRQCETNRGLTRHRNAHHRVELVAS